MGARIKNLFLVFITLTGFLFHITTNAEVQAQQKYQINLPAQSVANSLTQLSEQVDVLLLFPSAIARNLQANPVHGEYTLPQALDVMLEGTGYSGGLSDKGVLMISLVESKAPDKNESQTGERDMNNQLARKPLYAIIASFLATGLSTPEVIAAEQTVTDGVKNNRKPGLEEIVVTAQKREQKLIDVPMSIVALGSEEIKARKLVTLEDLALVAPGFAVRSAGVQRRIYMRGVSNITGSGSQVGLYLDEAAVTTGGTFSLDLQALDLARVEVLRGPQGTLYGEASQGGTIRFITNDPQLDGFSGRTDISASFTEGGDPGQRVEGVLNVPLVNDTLGLRVAASYQNAGGWIDQPAASKDNINDEQRLHVRTKLLWQPTEQFRARAMATVHRNNGSVDGGEDAAGNYLHSFGLLKHPARDDDYDLYNLSLTYDFGAAQLLSSSTYIDQELITRNFSIVSQLDMPPAPLSESQYDLMASHATVYRQELRLGSIGDGPFQWTVGAFYSDYEDSSLIDGYHPRTLAITYTIGKGAYKERKSWAVFGDASYGLTDRLQLGVGLRYYKDDQFSHSTPLLINGTSFGVVTEQDGTFDAVSPRFYATYKLTDGINLYTNIAKGFRSGGFNSFGLPPYDAETLWSYELGAKMAIDRFSAEVTAYYSDYTDYVSNGLDPNGPLPTTAFTQNAGDMEIKGVEWAFGWQATDRLDFVFNGSYVDTELVNLSVINTSQKVGDPASYVPDYQFVLSANYSVELLNRPGTVRLDYNRVGESVFISRKYTDPRPWVDNNSSDVIDMLGFRFSWQWSETVSFVLFAQNVLNERGHLSSGFFSSTSPSITGRTADSTTPRARPRTLGVEFAVEF